MISEYFRNVKRLFIQGKPYKILWEDWAPKGGEEGLESIYLGKISTTKLVITLAKDLPIEKLMDVYFHEIFHGINEELDLNLEEKTISTLATALVEFITKNVNIEPNEEILE